MNRASIAFLVFVGIGIGVGQARLKEPPAGLTVVDWAQIRALYEQHRHTATLEDDGSYVARNPGQGWRVRFDGRGFAVHPDEGDWTWGLKLVGFGVEGARQAIDGKAAIRAKNRRGGYGWRRELEELIVNDKAGRFGSVRHSPEGPHWISTVQGLFQRSEAAAVSMGGQTVQCAVAWRQSLDRDSTVGESGHGLVVIAQGGSL